MSAILGLSGPPALAAGASLSAAGQGSDGVRLVRVPGTPVQARLWEGIGPDGTEVPYYAISFDGRSFSEPRPTSYLLKLRHGDFDPAGPMPRPAIEAGFEAAEDTNLYIVQFVTQPLEAYRAAIEELGGTVHVFLANHAHICKLTPEVRDAVEALSFVRWVGPYHPAYRLEEFMLDNVDRAAELYPQQRYNIMIFESGMAQKQSVAEKIRRLGGLVDREDAGKYLVEATLTPEQLFAVARFDEVLFIDRWGEYEKDMNNAREFGGANYIETEPLEGFTGEGVRGEVFDAGFNLTHVDFASRPLIQHGAVGSDSHGAATSGICFGDGTGNPIARGLLPEGQGIVADYNTIGLEGPTRYTHSGELVQAPYYAVFQTSSVGSPRTTEYSNISADTDAAIFDFDLVHCQSQSNAGDQMSRPQAWAKNIISGGGVWHYDNLDTGDDCWGCDWSAASIGPAADGRIKPDLCAFYDAIYTTSTGSSTAYTSDFGGTSGATPIIAGHVGLFFDMWADGVFGNEVDPGGTVFENRAHAMTAKAMLINTANQYTFSGTSHDLTRVHQGWGWPNVKNMWDLRDKMLIVDEEEVLPNLGSVAYNIGISGDEAALRATLVYADPPGTTSSSQHRINDLTLKVTSPTGTVYWGNNGLLASMWSTPGGEPNTIDTVENVFVQNPEAGSWTIEVIASEINEDSHVESPELDADFALVVSGGALGPGFGLGAEPGTQAICTPADAVYTIEVTQFVGYSEAVTLTAEDNPAGTLVIFADNPVVPPATTTMTVSGTGHAAPGHYSIKVTGTSMDMERITYVGLDVSTGAPPAVSLLSPGNGATNVSVVPTFEWADAAQAAAYDLEVALDAGFNNIVLSTSTEATSYEMTTALETLTTYYWHVRGGNACGDGPFSSTYSFTTADMPAVLLVDDDDNNPDVQSYYVQALGALGVDYDLWNTNNSDNEPTVADLAPYDAVVWFTGDEYGGFCGPGSAGEAALASWLDDGGCLFISGQDYFYDRGLTSFMNEYLGVASAVSDEYQATVTGAGSVFGGMGPYTLSYPFSNWSDIINPDPDAELAFSGDIGNAAVDKDSGVYRTTFWGFPLEAVASAADRADLMQTVLEWCTGLEGDCPWDCEATPDGAVDIDDLVAVINHWGPCPATCPWDCEAVPDGEVDIDDLVAVINHWGACP